jgi:penicillin-binding protein-related factor A (putative recombinase)
MLYKPLNLSGKPKRKKGKEGDYTTYLIKGFQRAGGWSYKIPDPVAGGYKTNTRPFDIITCLDGASLAVECKWQAEPKAFGAKQLADHQIESLKRHEKAGGRSYVALFVKAGHRVSMLVWRINEFLKQKTWGKSVIEELAATKGYQSKDGAFPIGAFQDPPHQHLYGFTE